MAILIQIEERGQNVISENKYHFVPKYLNLSFLKFVKSNRFTFASLIEVRRSSLRTSRVNQLLLTDFNIYFKIDSNNDYLY